MSKVSKGSVVSYLESCDQVWTWERHYTGSFGLKILKGSSVPYNVTKYVHKIELRSREVVVV